MVDGAEGRAGGDALVGREREIAALRGWFDEARRGMPRLVLCHGVPGIGKTRLVTEFAREAGELGAAAWWARAHEDVGTPPFFLWRQLLRCRHEPGVVDDLLSPASGDRYAVFDAVNGQVAATGRQRPLVVVVEDAHWADEPSLLLLRYVVRELRDAPVLVVVTYRSLGAAFSPAWSRVAADLVREATAEQLALRGLDLPGCAAVFESVAGRPLADANAEEVYRLTGGNPFYVRELARTHQDDGSLALSTSLIEVVAQHVDRLSPEAGRVLAAGAVLGERFPLTLVAAMLDVPLLTMYPLLEEARVAALLAVGEGPGEWRFPHALVRDAVEARVSIPERAALHRAAAAALERTDRTGSRTADIARHRVDAVIDGADAAEAARWAARAGDEAMGALAYEDSARWYRCAADVAAEVLDEVARCELSVALARALWLASDLEPCVEAVEAARRLARAAGRNELLAEAVLVVEPIGSARWDARLAAWCEEALAGAGGAVRARLLARLAEAAMYAGDERRAVVQAREALDLADATADTAAVVAALRARQLALSGPEHVSERAGLAERMTAAGLVLRRPDVEQWGRQWRIDTCWETGDLAGVAAELPRLERCVEQVGGPIARWHLLNTRAALAGALGRYDDALAMARDAFDSVRSTSHPAAGGAYMSLLCTLGNHVGPTVYASVPPDVGATAPVDADEVRGAIFAHVGAALVLLHSGDRDGALAAYRGAGPPDRWHPPPYFRVLAWAYGSLLAVALRLADDATFLHGRLEGERGRFAVAGAGTASFGGPVELYLGQCALYLGRLDEAVADLESALGYCRRAGAEGYAVEAAASLGAALVRRAGPGDAERAQSLLQAARAVAARLGMAPWQQRMDDLLVRVTPAYGGLSAREAEVAELVARGMTNRQIAKALFVSERTAQTHVQHILTKLGFSNRSQITAWVVERSGSPA